MGIYDREYIRVGPRSSSGLGSLRFISVNSWIILINVAVFVLGATVFNMQREWVVGEVIAPGTPAELIDKGRVDRSVTLPVSRASGFPTLAHPIYVPVVGPDGSPSTDLFGRPAVQVIGQQLFIVLPLLEGLGHFSTLRAFFGLELWRFLTFQFLHANFWHIFFNMFGLWVFGGMVEQYLGSKRYAAFYLTCGIFGAVSYLILNFAGSVMHLRLPGVIIDDPWTPLVGASAGVFGVILACAYIAPQAIVQLLFPPIPIKLKWFAYGYVAVAAWNLLRGGANAGGDAAHIGGALAGFFFIRNAHLLRDFFDIFGGRRIGRGPSSSTAEVERILGKVATQGLASLTDGEKRTLREATERQRRG